MYTFGAPPGSGQVVPNQMVEPPILSEFRMRAEERIFGELSSYDKGDWQRTHSKPGDFILKDIEWRM